MRFYTDDILITSAAADYTVCIWDVHTSTLIKSIRGTSEIVSLEIFKDEIITMHHSNSISFTLINDDVSDPSLWHLLACTSKNPLYAIELLT